MIAYEEYEILGDNFEYQSLEEFKQTCLKASVAELELYLELCLVEQRFKEAKYIKSILKR